MPFLTFLLEAVLISLSGVMAPGPITAVSVGRGGTSPHAGAWVAVGHGIVEFPLMVFIFYGLGHLLKLPHVKAGIAFVGGLFLLLMGIDMLRSLKQTDVQSRKYHRSPIIDGIVLSAGNPYFLIWWATVGATLILRSVSFGLIGFLIFAPVHWLCDLIWYDFLSMLSFKGGRFFGERFQRAVFAVCGVLLLFFSATFILDALGG